MPQVAISQATTINLSLLYDRFHRMSWNANLYKWLDDKFNEFKMIVPKEWLQIEAVIVTNYLTNVIIKEIREK